MEMATFSSLIRYWQEQQLLLLQLLLLLLLFIGSAFRFRSSKQNGAAAQGEMKDIPQFPDSRCMLKCTSGIAEADVIKQHLLLPQTHTHTHHAHTCTENNAATTGEAGVIC